MRPLNPESPEASGIVHMLLGAIVGSIAHPTTQSVTKTVRWIRDDQGIISAGIFFRALTDAQMRINDAENLCATLNTLHDDNLRIVTALVVGKAFTRRELLAPDRVVAYTERPDWCDIVIAWKMHRGQLRHIVAKREQKATKSPAPCASHFAPVASPPPIVKHKERDAFGKAVLDVRLPNRLRDHRENLAEALRALAADPTVIWSPADLAKAVERRRRSTGVKCPEYVMRDALPLLANAGRVTRTGDHYSHKPSVM